MNTQDKQGNPLAGLEPGDLLEAEGGALAVVRQTGKDGMILGRICGCGGHIDSLLKYTYHWSAEKGGLVDDEGEMLGGKVFDFTVTKGGSKDFIKDWADVPTSDDYESLGTDEHRALLGANEDLVKKCILVLVEGPNKTISMLKVIELLGIDLPEEKKYLLLIAIGNAEMRWERPKGSLIHTILGSLIFRIRPH